MGLYGIKRTVDLLIELSEDNMYVASDSQDYKKDFTGPFEAPQLI